MRVWNLVNGQCQHTLTGHTSLVGLLGLSPSYLVSAAADSTLRIWDPDTGELRHTLAAHTGAITCFQHDEFKVLSGSDGNLKMWNIKDGSVVRDLLTGITGVWQVVFEGRWCVAASNRNDTTVLDVWDFGTEVDDEWIGEPPNGIYDDETFSSCEDEDEDESADVDRVEADVDLDVVREKRSALYGGKAGKRMDRGGSALTGMEEDDEQEQADVDAMDQDLLPSDSEYSELEVAGRITDVDGQDSQPTVHERGHGKQRLTPGRFAAFGADNTGQEHHEAMLDSDDDYVLETVRTVPEGGEGAGRGSSGGARWLDDTTAGESGNASGSTSARHTRSPSTRSSSGITSLRRKDRERERDRDRENPNLLFAQPSGSSSSRSLPVIPSYQDTPTRPRIRPAAGPRRRQ